VNRHPLDRSKCSAADTAFETQAGAVVVAFKLFSSSATLPSPQLLKLTGGISQRCRAWSYSPHVRQEEQHAGNAATATYGLQLAASR
jgi:hypothetical protein